MTFPSDHVILHPSRMLHHRYLSKNLYRRCRVSAD